MRAANRLVDVRAYCRTTDSRHPCGRFPKVGKGLRVSQPKPVWGAAIPSMRLQAEFSSLAVRLDLDPRGSRGGEVGRRVTTDRPRAALEQALATHRPTSHHSSAQGVQDAAGASVARLEAAGGTISMAAIGRPTANAIAERFMRTLKEEEAYLPSYRDIAEARASIGRFLDGVYHPKRVHSALG